MGRQKNKRRRSDPYEKHQEAEETEKLEKEDVAVERNANQPEVEKDIEKALVLREKSVTRTRTLNDQVRHFPRHSCKNNVSPFLCSSWQLKSAKVWETVHNHSSAESLWSELKELAYASRSSSADSASTLCKSNFEVSPASMRFPSGDTSIAIKDFVNCTFRQKGKHYAMSNEHLSERELLVRDSGCNELSINVTDAPSIFTQDEIIFTASLKNILPMLQGMQNYELTDHGLHQPIYLKTQLEFMHDVLLNMQFTASQNDVLDFIIQHNLITSNPAGKEIQNPNAARQKHTEAHKELISEAKSHGLLLDVACKKHMKSFEDSTPKRSNTNISSWTISAPRTSRCNWISNNKSSSEENFANHHESPAIESVNNQDSSEWSNEDLSYGDFNRHLTHPSVKNFVAAVTSEITRAGIESWSHHECPCLVTSYFEELKHNFATKFRLYLHLGRNSKTLPVKNDWKTREMCPIVKLERSSLWFQQYFGLNNLVSDILHKVEENANILLYSSHWYYTLKLGYFGTHLGIFSSGHPVVVKCMDSLSLCDGKLSVLQRMREKEIRHDNLSRVYGAYFCRKSLCTYVISEVCEFNLIEYLRRPGGNVLGPTGEPADAQFLIIQLIKAMTYLHELPEPIIHGHLKPENILITCNSQLKVADYYLVHARPPVYSVEKDEEREQRMSSLSWRAQEQLDALSLDEARKCATKYSDIQVVGMLIYYIFSMGRHPFGSTDEECYENIRNGFYDLRGRPMAIEGQDLVEEMLRYTPCKRLAMSKAFSHPYFWTLERRFDFLLGVERNLVFIARKHSFTYEMLGRSCLESRDWLFYIREDLFHLMKKKREYGNNFVDLLHFFADLDESFPSLPCYMRKFVEDPAKYALSNFPSIFMSVYYVLRKNRILQRQIKLDSFFYGP